MFGDNLAQVCRFKNLNENINWFRNYKWIDNIIEFIIFESPDRFNSIGKSGKNVSKVECKILRQYLYYEFSPLSKKSQ